MLGVAGGWLRWASDGNNGDDMALSLRRGLLEAESLPTDCQGFSSMGDSDVAIDVSEGSLGGVLIEEGLLLVRCWDDRLDPLDASKMKLTDDFLRPGSSSLLSTWS